MRFFFIILFSFSTCFAQGVAGFHLLNAGSYPTDEATAYIAAVEASGRTLTLSEKAAVDTLVRDLKGLTNPRYTTGVNFWTADKGYYILFWGAAAANSINLRSPGTYNITWNGTLSHSTTGVKPTYTSTNPTTHYGNTGIVPTSGALLQLSYYTPDATLQQGNFAFGTAANVETGVALNTLFLPRSDRTYGFDFGNFAAVTRAGATLPVGTSPAGLYVGTEQSTSCYLLRNGVEQRVIAKNNADRSSAPFYLFAVNDVTTSSARYAQDYTCSWASVGAGRSSAEAVIFSTIINEFHKRLSKNVY